MGIHVGIEIFCAIVTSKFNSTVSTAPRSQTEAASREGKWHDLCDALHTSSRLVVCCLHVHVSPSQTPVFYLRRACIIDCE